MFRLIDKTTDIIFFSINWKNYFDRSILVISMTVLLDNWEINCLPGYALQGEDRCDCRIFGEHEFLQNGSP